MSQQHDASGGPSVPVNSVDLLWRRTRVQMIAAAATIATISASANFYNHYTARAVLFAVVAILSFATAFRLWRGDESAFPDAMGITAALLFANTIVLTNGGLLGVRAYGRFTLATLYAGIVFSRLLLWALIGTVVTLCAPFVLDSLGLLQPLVIGRTDEAFDQTLMGVLNTLLLSFTIALLFGRYIAAARREL